MASNRTIDEECSDPVLREIARIDDVSPPDVEAELLGSSLGRFRVISLLGRGGMGVVYLAEDEALRREVALKVLAPDVAEDPDRRRRLLREARAAAAVSHSSIAAVYEVGEAKGLLYIAMERVQGESLRARMAREPLGIEEATRIARQVLEGLCRAHEAGIIHRDLKPENVMVDDAGHVKILDFGLAKFMDEDVDRGKASTMLTEDGRLLGTPSYMSPEQAGGLPVDARSDVFSFGIVLYEMVTGELPFQGTNFLKILASIERDEPAAPSRKNARVLPELEQVILRCLKKELAERYANAREVLQDLEKEKPAAPAPRRTTKWQVLAAAGVILAVAGIAGLAGRTKPAKSESIASSASPGSSAVAAPVPTPITELPPPKTSNLDALAAYREGLQAMRDGAWTNAHAAFKRSVELDPMLGAGHLRVALTGVWNATTQGEVSSAYRKAISLRDTLSERDRRLLDVLSPVIQQDPPDPMEAKKRLAAAARQYPGDVEWIASEGLNVIAPDMGAVEELDVAERCLALDPRYADCWQGRSRGLARLGRIPEAFQSFERCIEVSPAGNDCLQERRELHSSMGQCAAMEADVRLVLANDPNQWRAHAFLATSLLAQGRAPATVRAALEQGWEKAPMAARTLWRELDEVPLAYLAGQFEDAEHHTLAWAQKVAQNPFDGFHRSILYRIALHYETLGRTKEAGKAADDYLGGREAWTKPFLRSIWNDATLWSAKRKLNAGSMSRAAFVAARADFIEIWEKRLSPDMHGLVWLLAYANLARTAEEAKEALDAKPELSPLGYYSLDATPLHSDMGYVYLLAGHPAEAIPHLEKAVAGCDVLFRPIAHTLDHYHLGMAKEALSETKGACASYKVVLDRWGHAKPRVPAAEDARARAKALRCEP